jgi:hypothetical protein
MRQQHVAHVLERIAERLHLLGRRLRGIEFWRGLPHPALPQPPGRCDVVEADAGVDKGEPVIGLDQEAVADQPGALEKAASAIHQAAADRAHRAGVEMVDFHRVSLPVTSHTVLSSFIP